MIVENKRNPERKKIPDLILILVQELKQLGFSVLQKKKQSSCVTLSWKNI